MATDHSLRELEMFLANVDYERSTMGPFLDRLELYSRQAPPERPRVPGRFRKREQSLKALPKACVKCAAPLKDEGCNRCGWSHVLERYRVTADITSETHTSQSGGPNEDRLVRYAKTSRRFSAFERLHPLHAGVLAVYYGVEATRYDDAPYDPYRRLLAVMPMTVKGQELVQRILKERLNAADTDPERIRMAAAQGKLKEQVSTAAGQAIKLHVKALELWRAMDDEE